MRCTCRILPPDVDKGAETSGTIVYCATIRWRTTFDNDGQKVVITSGARSRHPILQNIFSIRKNHLRMRVKVHPRHEWSPSEEYPLLKLGDAAAIRRI